MTTPNGMPDAVKWPALAQHPAEANEVARIAMDAVGTVGRRLVFSERYAIANALLEAGWRGPETQAARSTRVVNRVPTLRKPQPPACTSYSSVSGWQWAGWRLTVTPEGVNALRRFMDQLRPAMKGPIADGLANPVVVTR